MSQAVMQMDEFTQRNAEMAQQTSSVAGSMTAQAKALTDLISLFRIESAGPIAPPVQLAPRKPAAVSAPTPVLKKVAGSDMEWQEF